MSQEWDIDDILASLDELLQEGKDAETKGKENLSPIRATTQSAGDSSQKNKCLETKKEVAKVEPLASNLSSSENVVAQPNSVEKIKLQPPKTWDIDVPDANFRHEPSVDGEGEPPILPRVILTQDMMVDPTDNEAEAFFPLLDAMDEDDVCEAMDEGETSQKVEKHTQGIHLNSHQLEQVLELVSMDVSYQFNQLLPNIIRQSLYKHLNMRQDENLEQEQNKQKNEKP
ncbi:MAG: hypothetical protein Q9N02_07370 [Ghiorsea sp.]|nr:hypothetical protein [Ghiorsea sp.]